MSLVGMSLCKATLHQAVRVSCLQKHGCLLQILRAYSPCMSRNDCMGIGRTVNSLHRMQKIRRPLHFTQSGMSATLLSAEELFRKKSLQQYLKEMETEYTELLKSVNLPEREQDGEEDVKLKRRRFAHLAPLVECVKNLELKQQEYAEMEVLLKDEDPGMRELAEMDWRACQEAVEELRQKILSQLIPAEEQDESDLVLELCAGVGGQEAMLFTAEVFLMYQSFAAFQGWRFETLEFTPSEIGGLRHATASISGLQSYKRMKFEGGIHRVQRVPKTEKQGRLHTSTMSVAVLPQPTEITFTINPKDLRIETKRASGAGGQHVNTTDSAVRIVHMPTGVVSECQQDRSQLKNREKAMQVLRAKLYSLRLEEETSKRHQARKIQIGTKGRSEKIRTYNFSQDRITDHRIGKTVHNVRAFLLGEDLLEEMNVALLQFGEQEALLDVLEEHLYLSHD
ncbi:peptide chain release factor 1-like, mitochondrial isoform X1 [Conger conger]|uniref:peptide chain release factor 1-like, mitochondrial isoform X1 n=2 Tax=Conger conger TaxID=82655 RepID=UPI002A5AA237|nr:peptide chain release factor 1-like, mitochondrial isoform X1 [Conger conger]